MFGVSAGGSTTANTMFEDQRIKAGLSMDGPMFGPVTTGGLDRPFLLMDANRTTRKLQADQQSFWSSLRGWRLNTGLSGAAHISYGDEEGAAQTSVDTGVDGFSGRCCGCVDGLKLDRCELAQGALSAFAVVLRFDPGHDRQPQLLPGAPPSGIENVLLQQRKERFHRGVVTTGTDPAHRPG